MWMQKIGNVQTICMAYLSFPCQGAQGYCCFRDIGLPSFPLFISGTDYSDIGWIRFLFVSYHYNDIGWIHFFFPDKHWF